MTVRVAERVRRKFHVKASRHGLPSEVLRELIEAFIEDRLVINPPSKMKEPLYVTRN